MNALANQYGEGFMPSSSPSPTFGQGQPLPDCLPHGCYPPSQSQAVSALSPNLYRSVCECHAIYGAGYGASLANILGKVSFAVSGNFRICGNNGRSMPLSLHIRFAGARLSGKSEAHLRLNAPVAEAMKGWKKPWLFDNVLPPTLLRKLRAGSVLAMLSMQEGRGHLAGALSRSFQDLSDLYDSNMPSFDRADDDEELAGHALESAILVACVNVQDDAHRKWLESYGQDAMASGYLFRLLMIECDELAIEGAGAQQPELALLNYDDRIIELITSARVKLKSMAADKLPVIDVAPEAEQILRKAKECFRAMSGKALSPRDTIVFSARLCANARRIAGCMHVFEGYEGAVSADTMARAVTIAEYFGACWLATVFPPKPLSAAVQRGRHLLATLVTWVRQSQQSSLSWREADIVALAPNYGWSKAEMKEAMMWMCCAGFAQILPRTENGRRVIKFELNPDLASPQLEQLTHTPIRL
ncbi:DUF3987 domain-containing protein [Caballeronia sp. LZ032]|uniref:DUF3987 domain-containing protein n=1 Tax=Caballeronia sp. LZ032 TaxID=3038565 RepID=UPI0028649F63|nr:DUF3987 domain-containing protein [Caballeronia sp. LZ032]MDR5879643.1 DUF3987 domain-containing protein [Caballeronia sp. LZ032]